VNKQYRIVWQEATQQWVVASELAQSHGPSTSVLGGALRSVVLAFVLTPIAWAASPVPTQLPTGGQVVAGQAAISQSATVLNVNQSSQRAAIDWQSFNVGSAAQVNFNQPNSNSVTLNRVLDNNPSQIFGRITAPGQVFLVNPAGAYFAPSASVEVGGLMATTHSLSNEDFMAGRNTLVRNGATGRIVNDGQLKASLGGYIALLAPEVRNNGVVVAQMGTVALAAGEAYTLQFDGKGLLSNVVVTPATMKALVENGNAVETPGGLIILSAQAASRLQGGIVNNTGSLQASGLVKEGGRILLRASDQINHSGSMQADAAPDSAGQGGNITLIADLNNPESVTRVSGSISAKGGTIAVGEAAVGTVEVVGQGRLNVSSSDNVGGNVTLLGARVGLFDQAAIDASGATGGGTVRLGGEAHGANAEFYPWAREVVLGPQTTITASATSSGNGGQVVLWSRDITGFYGAITARGGRLGGNGGWVETSSHGELQARGTVDTAASTGITGTWLLDPGAITIQASGTASGTSWSGGFASAAGSGTYNASTTSVLNWSDITGALANNNVTIATGSGSYDLTVAGAVNYGSTNSLTLSAGRSLAVNGAITNTGTGALTLLAAQSDPGTLTVSQAITTTGGAVTLYAGQNGSGSLNIASAVTLNGAITTNGGAITAANSITAGCALVSGGCTGLTVAATLSAAGTSQGGNIALTGYNNASGGSGVRGIVFNVNGISVTTSHSGTITATGTGGTSTSAIYGAAAGIAFNQPAAIFTTGTGAVQLSGTARDVGNNGDIKYAPAFSIDAVTLSAPVAIYSSGGGNVSLTGTSSANSPVVFVDAANGASNVLAVGWDGTSTYTTGNVSITGSGGTTAGGLFASGNSGSNGLGFLRAATNGGTLTLGDNGGLLGPTTLTSGTVVASGSYRSVAIGGTNTAKISLATPLTTNASATAAGGITVTARGDVTITSALSTSAASGVPVSVLAGRATAGAIALSGAITTSGGVVTLDNILGGAANITDNANITLGTAGTLAIQSATGSANSLSGVVSGTSAFLNLSGGGTTTLTGTNTYTGATTISASTLQIGNGSTGSIVSGSVVAANNGATLALNLANGATFDSTITNSGTVSFMQTGTSITTVSGGISGPGAVTQAGSGTTILSGTNTYTGATTVSAGTLKAGSINTFSSGSAMTVSTTLDLAGYTNSIGALTGSGTVTNNAASLATLTVTVPSAATATFSGVLQNGTGGNLSLTKAGSGTQVLTGTTNTYTGATTVSAGTLRVGNGTAIPSGSGVTVGSGATLALNLAGTTTFANAIDNSGTVSFIQTVTSTTTVSNAISGSGAVTQAGTGTTILSGTNTYIGATTVSAGTLRAGSASAFGSGSAVAVNATLDLAGNTNSIGTLTGNGTVTNSGPSLATLTVNVSSGATATFSGVLQNGTGGNLSLTKAGPGTQILTGTNTYTGATTVSAGTLQIGDGSNGAIGSTSAFKVSSGATLALNLKDTIVFGNTIDNSGTLSFIAAAGTITVSGAIIGAGAVTQVGTGSTILSGINTYTGDTTVSDGTLRAGSNSAFGSGSAMTVNAALNLASYSNTIGALSGNANGIVSSNNGAAILTVNVPSGANATFSGKLQPGTGGLSLTKAGPGTQILANANTYTGATNVNAGTLQVGDGTAGSIASGSGVTVNSGATLALNLVNNASFANTIADSGTVSFNQTGGNTTTVSGAITGTGAVIQAGAGTTILSGTNNYSGATSVNAGTLQVGDGTAGSIASGSGVTVNSGATLALNLAGNTTFANTIDDGGTVNFMQAGTTTASNVISGTGAVTQAGTGTTILSGTNTYSGATTVSAGTLRAGSTSAFGSVSPMTVNGTLDLAGYSNTIAGLSGNSSGTVTNNGADATLTVTVSSTSTATFSGGIQNGIGGNLSLNKAGLGTQILDGTNTHTGATTVNAGTLQIGNDGLSGTLGSGNVNVAENASLVFNRRSDTTIDNPISGLGTVMIKIEGTVTASNSWSVGTFKLESGSWVQNSVALPTFYARDFQINGGSFLRVNGGNGSAPFQISDVYGLQGINSKLSSNYVLVADIDANGTQNWNSGAGFLPLGNVGQNFAGNFNGGDHTIRSLYINRPDSANPVGLFGYVKGASISHVKLADVNITGGQYVGGLAGGIDISEITQTNVSGQVVAQISGVGGLFGFIDTSTINQSYSTASVRGSNAGGLVGTAVTTFSDYNNGQNVISQSYASGTVNGMNSLNNGGLVGYMNNTVLRQSYATGDVSGAGAVGGLVGLAEGSSLISQTYATGRVSGVNNVGGLVGNLQNSQVTQSYAIGLVSGNDTLGGLIGAQNNSTISQSYRNKDTSDQLSNQYGTPLTTAQFKQNSNFEGWNIATTGGSESAWRIYEDKTTPLLRTFLTNLTLSSTSDNVSTTYNRSSPVLTAIANNGSIVSDKLLGTDVYVNAGTYSNVLSTLYSGQQGYDIKIAKELTTLQINPAQLSLVGVSATSRAYSGSTAVTLTGTGSLSGTVYGGDDVTLFGSTSSTGTLVSANAGPQLVTVDSLGYRLEGAAKRNYQLISSLMVNISQATVTLSSIQKTYDGTTGLGNTTMTIAGVGTEKLRFKAATYYSKDVDANGSNYLSALTLQDGNNGELASNYKVPDTLSVLNAQATIDKASLIVAAKNASKTYDGQAFSGGNGVSYNGFVNNETSSVLGGTLAYGGTSQNAVNAGTYTLTASGLTSQNYAISYADGSLNVGKVSATVIANSGTVTYNGQAQSVSGFTVTGLVNNESASVLSGLSATGGSGTNVGSYNHRYSVGSYSGNYDLSFTDGSLSIGKANLTVTAKNASKTYDGQAFSGGNGVSYNGFVNNETSSVLGGTLAYGGTSQNAVNAGTYTLTASGLTSQNYAISYADGSLSIGKAPLNLTISKTYNGNTNFSNGNSYTLTGMVSGESSPSISSGSAAVSSANAATYSSWSTNNLVLSDSNYTLLGGTLSATITPKVLTLTGLQASNKVYDGTNTATIATFGTLLGGATSSTDNRYYAGDNVELVKTNAIANFLDPNVGTNKPVTVKGLTLSNSNYSLVDPTTTANISAQSLNLLAITGSRRYNGTTLFTYQDFYLTGALKGEVVSLTAGSANTPSPNVGTYNNQLISGLVISVANGSADNYTLPTMANLTITKAPLTINATSDSRAYNGTTTSAALPSYSTLFGNDSLTGLSQSFASKNAKGAGASTLNVNDGFVLNDGNGGGNYEVTRLPAAGTITPANLTIAGVTAASKVYDGTRLASLNGGGIEVFGNDSVTLLKTDAIGSFDTKDVGTAKPVTASGYVLSGSDAGNYNLIQPTGLQADITPKALRIVANNDVRTYDSIAYSGGNGVTYSGFVAGESESELVGSLSYGGTSQGAVNVGTYNIQPKGMTSRNYSLGFEEGQLSIVAAVPVVAVTVIAKDPLPVKPSSGPSDDKKDKVDLFRNLNRVSLISISEREKVPLIIISQPQGETPGLARLVVNQALPTQGLVVQIPLPIELKGGNKAIASVTGLPPWLSFDPLGQVFILRDVPPGVETYQVKVQVDGKIWNLTLDFRNASRKR
jgi:filamentous hemagglutinin family protein